MEEYIYRVHCFVPAEYRDSINNSLPESEYGPNSVSIKLYTNNVVTHYGTSFVATESMIHFLSGLFGNIPGMFYWTLDVNTGVLLYTNDQQNSFTFGQYLSFQDVISSKNLSMQ